MTGRASSAGAAERIPRVRVGFVAAMLAWFGAFAVAPMAFFALGVNHYGYWFLDTYAILASNDALRLGLDPYQPNPLDPFKRPHVYSHWWLQLGDLGLTRAHAFGLGLGLVTAFVVSVLAWLRPRRIGEALWYAGIFGAPPVLLAIDRANNDLVVFLLLTPVVPCLMSESRLVRLFPVFLIAVATALKYYPAVALLVLFLMGDSREVRIRGLISALLITAVGVGIARELAGVGRMVPRAESLTTFGAINLLEAVGLRGSAAVLVGAVIAGSVALIGWRFYRRTGGLHLASDRRPALYFALGAVLLTGCFFAGTNYAYRWIFAIWLAPWLWHLPNDAEVPAGLRRLAGVTRILLLVSLWADSLASAVLTRFVGRLSGATLTQLADRFFLWEQPVTWLLFACLLIFCAQFAAEAWRRLRGVGA